MLEYCMDLLPGSYGHAVTNDAFAQSFPYCNIDSGKFVNGERYYTKRDQYEGYLLIATDEGCGKLVWNNQSCLLEKGSAVIIDCSTYHEYCTLPNNKWSFYYLHFKALSMEGYKKTFLTTLAPTTLRMPEMVWQMIDQLYKMSFQADVLSYATQSNIVSNILTEMLYSLINNHTTVSRIYRQDIAELTEYIKSNCTKPLTVEDFSDLLHLSKSHLIRVFERQVGMSPYRYLHMCRINKALHLLRTTCMSVSQIAYAVGYGDPIVFTRHFKEYHRATPSTYRKGLVALPADRLGEDDCGNTC